MNIQQFRDGWRYTKPVPTNHIADWYDKQWAERKNLYNQLLRRGYRQLSAGLIEPCNNLFKPRYLYER